MADELPPLIAELRGDASDLMSTLAQVESALEAFAGKDYEAQLGLDTTPAFEELAAFLKFADAQVITIPVHLDLGGAYAQLASLKAASALATGTGSPAGGGGSAGTAGADAATVASLVRSAQGGGGGGVLAGAAAGTAAGGGGGGGGGGGLAGFLAALGFGKGGGIPFLGGLGAGLAGFGTIGSLAGLGPESLLTTILGVGGSAAGAVAGGGALALGSLGVAGVGLGTDMAGLGQAAKDAQTYTQELDKLNRAIAVYGANSIQAKAAQYDLNNTMQQLTPAAQAGVIALSQAGQQFHTVFDQMTGAAEATGAAILTQLVGVAQKFLPTIGTFAAQNMKIIQASLQPLFTWLQGPGLQIFTQLEQTFQSQLPTAMHAFTQGIELLIRTLGFLAPYTGHLITFLDDLFTKLNGSGWDNFTKGINTAITIFRDWEGLIKAVGTAIYELFTHDAGTGTALVVTLTNMVNKFNDWAKSTAGGDSLHALLESHKQEILAIVGILGQLISTWGQLEITVRPILQMLVAGLADVVNFILKIPGLGQLAGLGIALAILGSRVGIIGNALKSLALYALPVLGSMLASLGGPFEALGGWLTNLGTAGVSETAALTASVNGLTAALTGAAGAAGTLDTALAAEGAAGAAGTAEATGLAASQARGAVLLGGGGAAAVGTETAAAGATGAAGLTAMLGPIALVGAGFAALAVGANALGHAMGVGLNAGAQNLVKTADAMKSLPTGSLQATSTSLDTLEHKMESTTGAKTLGQALQVLHQAASQPLSSTLADSAKSMLSQFAAMTGGVSLAKTNISELSNATGLAAPIVKDLAQKLGVDLTKALSPAAVETLTNYIKQQGGVAAVTGQEWQASSESIQAALQLMSAKAQQTMPNVSKAVADMVVATQPSLLTLISNTRKAGNDAGAGIVSGFLAHLTPAQMASKSLHDRVLSPLEPLVGELYRVNDDALARAVQAWIDHQPAASNASKRMHDAITNPLQSLQGELAAKGDVTGADFVADYIKHTPGALNASGQMKQSTITGLQGIEEEMASHGDAAGAAFVQAAINEAKLATPAGQQFVTDLIAGVDSQASTFAQHVQALVNGAVQNLTIHPTITVAPNVTVTPVSTQGYPVQARAAGGPIDAGKTYLVGEDGPELFAAGYSGAIVPINMNSSGQTAAIPAALSGALGSGYGGIDPTSLSTLQSVVQQTSAALTAFKAVITSVAQSMGSLASAIGSLKNTISSITSATSASAGAAGAVGAAGTATAAASSLSFGYGGNPITQTINPDGSVTFTDGKTGQPISTLAGYNPLSAPTTEQRVGTSLPVGALWGSGITAVTPTNQSTAIGSTVLQVTTPFNIDGRQIASVVTNYQLRGGRATGNVLGQYAGGTQSQTSTGINPNAVPR